MNTVGAMEMPVDFRYKAVFIKGKPQHDRFDSFSVKHPRMELGRRAKIFSPFDALKGFNEAVTAKNTVYECKRELDREDQDEISRRLCILQRLTWNSRVARMNMVRVTVTHYVACSDRNNEAYGNLGIYKKISGICLNIDPTITQTMLIDKERIAFCDIYRIDNEEGLFEQAQTSEESEYCEACFENADIMSLEDQH